MKNLSHSIKVWETNELSWTSLYEGSKGSTVSLTNAETLKDIPIKPKSWTQKSDITWRKQTTESVCKKLKILSYTSHAQYPQVLSKHWNPTQGWMPRGPKILWQLKSIHWYMDQMYGGTCLDANAKDKAFLGPEIGHASALPFCSKKVQVLTENQRFLSGYKLKLQFDLKSLFQPKGCYDFCPKSELSARSFKQ